MKLALGRRCAPEEMGPSCVVLLSAIEVPSPPSGRLRAAPRRIADPRLVRRASPATGEGLREGQDRRRHRRRSRGGHVGSYGQCLQDLEPRPNFTDYLSTAHNLLVGRPSSLMDSIRSSFFLLSAAIVCWQPPSSSAAMRMRLLTCCLIACEAKLAVPTRRELVRRTSKVVDAGLMAPHRCPVAAPNSR